MAPDPLAKAESLARTLTRNQQGGEYPYLGTGARAALEVLLPRLEKLERDNMKLNEKLRRLEKERWEKIG